jgi:hypothetical protein
MINQEKQNEVSTHLVAPLSLTQKSNFHILADVKGEFLLVHFNTTWNALPMYDGALALGALFGENHEALGFAQNFLRKRVLQT